MMTALVITGDVFTAVTALIVRNCWSMLCNVLEEDLVFELVIQNYLVLFNNKSFYRYNTD